jgi:hypothetical protein
MDPKCSMSSTPGNCCDILKQDCKCGEKCVPGVDPNTNMEATFCMPAGNGHQGDPCTPATSSTSNDGCAPHFMCLATSSTVHQCFGICGTCDPSMPDAGPNQFAGACNFVNGSTGDSTQLYCNPGGSVPTYCLGLSTVATTPPRALSLLCDTSCDIFNPTSCSSGGTSGSCFVALGGPVCVPPAGAAPGADCSTAGFPGCATPGYSCYPNLSGSGVSCQQTCDFTQAQPAGCTGGKMCKNAMDPDIPHLGVCN